MTDVLPLLIGGLVLFLYAIAQLSKTLKGLFSKSAKNVIARYTRNVYAAILIGTIITVVLGSSSAVIILVIVFINSEALSFRKAIGLILGANIGTTFSSQIIALDIGKYSVVPLFLGLLIKIFVQRENLLQWGAVLLYFGMLFFGLFVIEKSVQPLHESEQFMEWLAVVGNNQYYGALIGGLITIIIQSSSGTVGIAIALGKQSIISMAMGISIMLGAELGTCSDTLLATINGKKQAIKAGLFHLLFNLSTIIIGLLLFDQFVSIVERVSADSDVGARIANAHFMFNFLGVLCVLPFVYSIERLLNQLIPD